MIKEKYFTESTIERKSTQILQVATTYSKKKKVKFQKNSIAFIILDMQRYFLSKRSHAFIPSSKIILKNIVHFKRVCENFKIPIIFTKHVNTNENSRMMKKWWDGMLSGKDKLSEITPELNPHNHIIIEKTQYDAFYNTNLEEYLLQHGITQLILSGVMTNLCCETTLRSSFIRGFESFLPIDLTAAYNYDFHLSTIKNLSFGFTIPVKMAHLIEKIEICYKK